MLKCAFQAQFEELKTEQIVQSKRSGEGSVESLKFTWGFLFYFLVEMDNFLNGC